MTSLPNGRWLHACRGRDQSETPKCHLTADKVLRRATKIGAPGLGFRPGSGEVLAEEVDRALAGGECEGSRLVAGLAGQHCGRTLAEAAGVAGAGVQLDHLERATKPLTQSSEAFSRH